MIETFIEFMDDVLGIYVPQTATIAGEQVALSGMAGVDWMYIGHLAVFMLCLYCIFRLIGGLLWSR